jgi:RND family efflux transporter MFP subunit
MRHLHSVLSVFTVACLLAACGKGTPSAPAKGPAAAASASAASAARLLLAPEDLVTLQPSRLASGPVVTGALQPEKRADLRAEVAAVVLQVMKDNGETVRAGDTLLRLDDTAIRDSLTSAEEAVRASTQAFEQTERTAQRLKTLQAQGMSSTQAVEDAEVRRNNAQSDLVAAKARVVSARQQMQRTLVRAPFDGVVSERKVSVGDTVQVGRELMKVIDPRSLRFEGLVSADRMGELKLGQAASFRVNGVDAGDFAGKLRRIDATANATTRQVAVVVDFADPAKAPRVAGLFAEGRIETGSRQVLTLSEGSLQRAGEAAHVWRLQGDQVNKVAVKLGERDARTGELPVLEGLAMGDRILRRPGSGLVDGQKAEMKAEIKAEVKASPALPASAAASASKP